MKLLSRTLVLAAGTLACALALAAAPATAPAGATGMCKDGSFTSNATKKGACKGHKGVKEWYADGGATAASAPQATARTAVAATPAPGGGPGQVWVNKATKVYHCPGTKYYGKTKAGEYMTEAAAKAAGNHPDHGKACS
jgi:Protein of unknown function (DUF3761)